MIQTEDAIESDHNGKFNVSHLKIIFLVWLGSVEAPVQRTLGPLSQGDGGCSTVPLCSTCKLNNLPLLLWPQMSNAAWRLCNFISYCYELADSESFHKVHSQCLQLAASSAGVDDEVILRRCINAWGSWRNIKFLRVFNRPIITPTEFNVEKNSSIHI